ncbi:MAG: phosphotransferase [Bdellovibrionales bacterium]|jgi:homoserine kinase type II|nr:phosphotransferase [Bdellovibrionales bacterium]
MAVYTELDFDEINQIVGFYDLGTLLDFVPLSLGISNSNYQVEVNRQGKKEKYLLKISNDKDHEQLHKEQVILKILKKLNFSYSICCLETKEGKMIYEHGDKIGVIFPFVEGIPPGPSDYTCKEIGRGLATLHCLDLNGYVDDIRDQSEVGYGPQQILDFSSSAECPKDFKSFFNRIFEDQLKEFLDINFQKGLIHGDLYYDNTLFDNNNLSAILDFEQSGLGPYIFDIGISISGTCLEKGRIIRPLIKSFMSGYESIRPLPLEEREFLNHSIILGLFSIALWRVKRFTLGDLDPDRADSYMELIQRAINFKNSMVELKRSPF